MDIELAIREILCDNVELLKPINLIEKKEPLIELGLDSISLIRVILNIEEKFNIIFDDDDLLAENFMDIESFTNYVKTKL